MPCAAPGTVKRTLGHLNFWTFDDRLTVSGLSMTGPPGGGVQPLFFRPNVGRRRLPSHPTRVRRRWNVKTPHDFAESPGSTRLEAETTKPSVKTTPLFTDGNEHSTHTTHGLQFFLGPIGTPMEWCSCHPPPAHRPMPLVDPWEVQPKKPKWTSIDVSRLIGNRLR